MKEELGLTIGKVTLSSYNPKWKTIFEEEKKNLETLLAPIAKEIEHVGSTSIEGLSAKPIIDIAIGLDDLKDFSKIKEKIKPPYYVKENPTEGEELIVKRKDETTTTHLIHVMDRNKQRYQETIEFRNYLIPHEKTKKDYEKLKKSLAKQYSEDRKTYTASKNDFIKEVLRKSREEKHQEKIS